MTITFDEAVNGCKKIIRLTIDEECPQCGGSGAYSRSDIKTCDKCHGSGYVFVEQRTILVQLVVKAYALDVVVVAKKSLRNVIAAVVKERLEQLRTLKLRSQLVLMME